MATTQKATRLAGLDEIIQDIDRRQVGTKSVSSFRAGDTVRVHVKIKEGDKERIQVFQGVVIERKGAGNNAQFTVRKISYGVGVERMFPLYSPSVDKVEVVTTGRVRQANLYFVRGLRGKAARIREKRRSLIVEEGVSESVDTLDPAAVAGAGESSAD